MDSFDQNAIVKVGEMKALYNAFQLKFNSLEQEIDKLKSELQLESRRNNVYFKELKDKLNNLSIWEFIKKKLKHQEIC